MKDEDANKPDPDDLRQQRHLGTLAAVSIIWLVVAFLSANAFVGGIAGLKPNEFGDLLAGAFAPVAATWFIYAVFMQRAELSLQRKELSLTRKVLIDQQESQSLNADAAMQSARSAKIQADSQYTQIRLENFMNLLNQLNFFRTEIPGIKLNLYKDKYNKTEMGITFSLEKNDSKISYKYGYQIAKQIKDILFACKDSNYIILDDNNVSRLRRYFSAIEGMDILSGKGSIARFERDIFELNEFHLIKNALDELFAQNLIHSRPADDE